MSHPFRIVDPIPRFVPRPWRWGEGDSEDRGRLPGEAFRKEREPAEGVSYHAGWSVGNIDTATTFS